MVPATMKSHLFNFVVAICILFSSAADAAEELSKQLATPLSGGDFFSGVMFDVVATHDMELKGISFHTSATTSIDMSVYTRAGRYEGNELDETEWTLIGTKDIIGLGGGLPTPYTFDSPILLLEGEKRAFYMATTTGPFLRTSQTSETGFVAGDEAYSNDDIIVKVGVGKKQGWDGVIGRTTIFEGVLSYDLYFYPSMSPTGLPTVSPSAAPSNAPSAAPNASPSISPSSHPTTAPSNFPTSSPSSSPSTVPTISSMPSATPSAAPSTEPTVSSEPSATPTLAPSSFPSASPSAFPSMDLEGLTIRSNVFKAVKDTYIMIGSNETFGNDESLRVDGDPQCISLIQFNISSLNGGTEEEPLTVYGAQLKLNALTGSDFGGSVSIYYNLDFDEGGANSDSDGSWAGLTETYHVGEFGKATRGNSYTLDIIDAFRKKPLPSTFSVRITSDGNDGVDYSSREGSKGPRVIFDFAYEPTNQTKLAETFGTDAPTLSPTITKTWEDNTVPTNPPSRYFNYDPSSDYGPDRWRKGRGTTDLKQWQNLRTDRNDNKCGSGTRQSPRDLCGHRTRNSCREKHQIRRNSRGDFGFKSGEVSTPIAEIHPHKLSLRFPERSSGYLEKKEKRRFPDVPRADFSVNGYNSGEQPLVFLDIKTKSEHKICGRRYDVELQYFYLHWYGNLEAVAVLGEVDENMTRPNRTFQQILNYFQRKANKDINACKEKQRRARALFRASKGSEKEDMSTLQDEPGSMEERDETSDDAVEEPGSGSYKSTYHKIMSRFLNIVDRRDLSNRHEVNFYDPDDIWHSEWFIGYQGSVTFPPCSQKVNWRVMDVPFKITKAQLRQLRNIQFEHVNPNTCSFDSVHHNESNARPIQKYKGGRYYRCTHRHYPSDAEREDSGVRTGFSDRSKWYGPDKRPFMKPAKGLSRT